MIKWKHFATANHHFQYQSERIWTEGQKAAHTNNILITLKAVQKLHSPYRSIHKCINSDLTNNVNTRWDKTDKELPINQTNDIARLKKWRPLTH